jgi:hypothetical protein
MSEQQYQEWIKAAERARAYRNKQTPTPLVYGRR